jgi:hypothetical protein
MDPAALAGLCVLLARGDTSQVLPAGVVCPAATATAMPHRGAASVNLATRVTFPAARDAIARVAFAEAGNQGDSGLAAVVYTLPYPKAA